MGQIQNAITGAISAGIGAAIAREAAKSNAWTQLPKAEEDLAAVESELGGAYLEQANKEAELAGNPQSNPLERLKAAGLAHDIEIGERAIKIKEGKEKALKTNIARFKRILKIKGEE